ncbi:MAG: translation initiation factor [Flavobacteriales bacterium]|nr:translation initiation factor [Flavobacteriales bacterium]
MGKDKNRDGYVYSTNDQFSFDDDQSEESLAPEDQLLEIHLEKKGRGGKVAIVVKGFVGDTEDLKDLCKLIKSKCGVGGTVKNGEIIIQGDIRPKVTDILEKEGYKTKRIGG